MVKHLREIIEKNRSGVRVAIPSVCTAQPDALRASLQLAQRLGRKVVIEATSNQVNQDGGYTGMTPKGFVTFVQKLADASGVDRDLILFGGDHLGPQAWRSQSVDAAMAKAEVMLRDYVAAGFDKIHLDCSEGCAGEAAQLGDEQTAQRSAKLARICNEVNEDLLFVVGTEVPPPGGARANESGDIPATESAAARATLAAHDEAFGDLAPLIGGLVVQPGVEFGPSTVHHMPLDRDPGLLAAIADRPGVCLEAHSTDYQDPRVFPRLAELGFAFQKVGPALTFAYREALYGLDQLRSPKGQLQDRMEKVMLDERSKWDSHYSGDDAALYQQRHFGLADRIRYYWPAPSASTAVEELKNDLPTTLPDIALEQVFGRDVLDRSEKLIGSQVQRIIDAQIEIALEPYFFEEAP